MRRLELVLAFVASGLALGTGCGGSDGGGVTLGGPGAPLPRGAAGPGLTVLTAGGLPQRYEIHTSARNAPVQVFSVFATYDVTVRSVTIKASGTANDATAVSAVRLALDDGDGSYDPSKDPPMGGLALFQADDGKAVVGGMQHRVARNTGEFWWVLFDMSGAATPGQTIHADIETVSDVDATDSRGSPAQVNGPPTASPEGLIYLGKHLMVSEICTTPTWREFIEITNPTPYPVDLSNVYIGNVEDRPTSTHYYNLPLGQGMGPASGRESYDFIVKFPAGARIQPGQYVTIAYNGTVFNGEYHTPPDYQIVQQGGMTGIPRMVNASTVALPVTSSATSLFSDERENVVLFSWDGASDLVQDLDIVNWGDDISRFYIDKTGVTIGGHSYAPDTGMLYQQKIQSIPYPNSLGLTLTRIDYLEGGEIESGGNGIGGHDETSEGLSMSWSNSRRASPGAR